MLEFFRVLHSSPGCDFSSQNRCDDIYCGDGILSPPVECLSMHNIAMFFLDRVIQIICNECVEKWSVFYSGVEYNYRA